MWIALILGLTGSVGHCSGMCSGIVMLLHRSIGNHNSKSAWVLIHGGRLASYTLLGYLAGWLGFGLKSISGHILIVQGVIAIFTAILGLYFVLTLLGITPSPEALFPRLVTIWRKSYRRININENPRKLLLLGTAWGLLPCGLVITALFTAAVSAAPLEGALRMTVFGLGTLPVLISAKLISNNIRLLSWPRYGAAAALAFFSVQLALRGMAAFGFINHAMIGKVMLW